MEIVTGMTGNPHVTPIDDAVRNTNYSKYSDRVVFNVFDALNAVAITANEVRVYSGYGMDQGRIFKIDEGSYDPVTIENGAQGVKRADLIVARYELDQSTGFEDISLVVIKGEAGSSYVDPVYTQANINEGATLDDFPLYRVKINGIVIEDVEPLFEALPEGGLIGLIDQKIDNHIANDVDPHTITWTEAQNLTSLNVSDTLAVLFGKIAKAVSSLILHIADKTNPHEVKGSQLAVANTSEAVPISKGGTGATTAAGALANLGVPSDIQDAMSKAVYVDANDKLKEGKGGIGSRSIDDTQGGTQNSTDLITSGAVRSQIDLMQTTFQDGVDAIYNAEVAQNVSGVPTASTPTALANGVGAIATEKYNAGYDVGDAAGFTRGRTHGRQDVGVDNGYNSVNNVSAISVSSGYYYILDSTSRDSSPSLSSGGAAIVRERTGTSYIDGTPYYDYIWFVKTTGSTLSFNVSLAGLRYAKLGPCV